MSSKRLFNGWTNRPQTWQLNRLRLWNGQPAFRFKIYKVLFALGPFKVYLSFPIENTLRACAHVECTAKGSATVSSASRRSARIQGSAVAVEEWCTTKGGEVWQHLYTSNFRWLGSRKRSERGPMRRKFEVYKRFRVSRR